MTPVRRPLQPSPRHPALRVRLLPAPLLPLLALVACSSSAPAPAASPTPPPEGSAAAPWPPPPESRVEGEHREAEPPPTGPATPITIRIAVEPRPEHGAISLVGARPEQLTGPWIEAGSHPAFWWSRPDAPLTDPVQLEAPLPAGLSYFVVVSVDGDDLPDPGDFVGGPVEQHQAGAALTVIVDRPFGAALRPPPAGVEPLALSAAPQIHAVELSFPGLTVPKTPTPVLVVGHAPRAGAKEGEDDAPAYLYRSEPQALVSPLRLDLPIPPGVFVSFVLDLDGDGRAGPADLASTPRADFPDPTPGGMVKVAIVGPYTAPKGPPPKGDEEPPDDPKVPARSVRLTTKVEMPFIHSGRVVVSGTPHREDGGESGPPSFTWSSEPLTLTWPLDLDIPLPRGLDLLVALDLDGSGTISPGDLSTPPLRRWAPPEGRAELVLSDVIGQAAK